MNKPNHLSHCSIGFSIGSLAADVIGIWPWLYFFALGVMEDKTPIISQVMVLGIPALVVVLTVCAVVWGIRAVRSEEPKSKPALTFALILTAAYIASAAYLLTVILK